MSSFQGDFIKKDNKIIFKVKDVDVSILNSIRRVILAEIENVAFEYKPYNTGDEQKINIFIIILVLSIMKYIQQRLSMLPLNFNVNEILDFDENNYKFVLKKKNDTNTIMMLQLMIFKYLMIKTRSMMINLLREYFLKINILGRAPILITKCKTKLNQ